MKRRITLILSALIACWLTVSARAAEERLDLEGFVTTTNGVPITNASVFVYTAAPRDGFGITCPSCYPDCGKRARTDAEGKFTIPSLDPELIFRLVVVAKGYRPKYVDKADPIATTVRARLSPLKIGDVPLENQVIGKIIDPYGRAVAGATLDVEGAKYASYSSYGSTSGRVDPLGVTDENGEFLFNCTNDVTAITVTIQGRALAKRRMWLDTGKAHLIRLKEGATVTGRLLHSGKPVPGAQVSMNTEERSAEEFMRGFEVATDSKGEFTLVNLPANKRYFLYTKMKEMQEFGVSLPPQRVATGADGATVKLGDLRLAPAHFVRGRVVLADGKPLPARTRIHLGLENAWDSQDQRLDEEGWFDFQGVPAQEIDVSVRVTGYRVSAKNPNKDWLNEGRIVGRLEGDLDNFIIHLEPGERFPSDEGPPDSDRQPRSKPLRGAKL